MDDDGLVRWALARELTSHRFAVDAVATCADARDRILRTDYRMVFLDIRLPDASGLDLLGEIHRASPRATIVVMSSDGCSGSKHRAFADGASQFIEKPFDLADIRRVVVWTTRDRADRRRRPRLLCRLPLRLSAAVRGPHETDFDLGNIGATAEDVGDDGLRVRTEFPLVEGQRVRVALIRADDPCARRVDDGADAEVVWTTHDRGRTTAGLLYVRDLTPGRTS